MLRKRLIESAGAQEIRQHCGLRIAALQFALQLVEYFDARSGWQQAHALEQVEDLVQPSLTALRLAAGQARIAPLRGAGLFPAFFDVAHHTRGKDAGAQEGNLLALWVHARGTERTGTEIDSEYQTLLYLGQRQIGH